MTCFDEFAGRWNLGVKNFEEKLMENTYRNCGNQKVNKNTTDQLLRADWLYAVQLGQLHCRSSATVELRR